jgi:ADP-ribose pyrophosphatase YjhB (NUDIX family)
MATSSSALGAGAGPAPATLPPVVGCPITNQSEPGYALVIAYYDDPIKNKRTFFMGKESSYVEKALFNSSGNPVMNSKTGKQKMISLRDLDPSLSTNNDRIAEAKKNADYIAIKNHIVLRKNKAGQPAYTIQRLPTEFSKHKWGFPKGSGNIPSESSQTIAIREFQEESGYTLPDPTKLLFKKCVVAFNKVCVVFFYHLNKTEHADLVTALTEQKKKKTSELFNIDMIPEEEVIKRTKNTFSKLAFDDFPNYEAATIDQTNIPRGGKIDSTAPAVPPAIVPSAPPAPPVVSTGKYVPPPKRAQATPGGSRQRRNSLRKTRRTRKPGRK